jgi:hypothetical protein
MAQARSVIDDCSAVLIDQANYERIKASVDKMPHEHPVPAWHDTVHFAASHDKVRRGRESAFGGGSGEKMEDENGRGVLWIESLLDCSWIDSSEFVDYLSTNIQ